MRVRNEATFRAFKRIPKFHVILSDDTIILAESLNQANARAATMKGFGHHAVIREIPTIKKANEEGN